MKDFFLKIKSTCVHHDYILNIIVQYSIPALPKTHNTALLFFLHEVVSVEVGTLLLSWTVRMSFP